MPKYDPKPDDVTPIEFKTLVFERIRVAVLDHISLDRLEMDCSTLVDFVGETFALRLTAVLTGRKDNESVEDGEQVPETWWDAVKLRFFPEWALERWPARERYVPKVVKRYLMCPHRPLDEFKTHINFLAGDQWKGST